jgi:HlyD family secretion protein
MKNKYGFTVKRVVAAIIIFLVILAVIICCYFVFRERAPSNELTLYGNVDVRQVDIGFRVAGRVEDLMYEEGDFVPKGSLMAVLNKTPYDSQIREAQANVSAVKATFKNAAILLKRRNELIGIGGVSQEDVDNSSAGRSQQLANLHAAEASLAVAVDNMNYTEVYAPTDGIILTRIREPGSVVTVSDPVYTLSVSSPVWIRAYVDETNLGNIAYGMEAEIRTDSNRIYKGKIGFISPVAEFTPKTVETAQLRTDLVYRLRIYADNPDRYLKQGMPVTVRLRGLSKNKVNY